VGAWFSAVKESSAHEWHFDVTKISVAAGVIYGYLFIAPLLLYGGKIYHHRVLYRFVGEEVT
jgi:hypothetical protein